MRRNPRKDEHTEEDETEEPVPEKTSSIGLGRERLGLINIRRMRAESDFRRDTKYQDRNERDHYQNFLWNMIRFDSKPKVSLREIVGPQQNRKLSYQDEKSLNLSVGHYVTRKNPRELIRVLKFYTAFMMQMARKAETFENQQFLLFKAVDFARMIVQYSSYRVNVDAEAIVLGVFSDLGNQKKGGFVRYMEVQQKIYGLMKKLAFSPQDHITRVELADTLMRQTSFYDAYAHYMFLLGRYPKMPPHSDTNRARVAIKMAEIFQNLVFHITEDAGKMNDARKLKNFIERYNRDYGDTGKPIPPITGNNPVQFKKTAQSMREHANSWYLRALNVKKIGPRMATRLISRMAENYVVDGKQKTALQALVNGYDYWRGVPKGVDAIVERTGYLNMVIEISGKLKKPDITEWAQKEQREWKDKMHSIVSEQDKREKRREAFMTGDPNRVR